MQQEHLMQFQVSKIIDLAQATTPVKKIGLIYSGNEDNATNTVKQCEEYLKSIND